MSGFVAHCLDLLSSLGDVRVRAMMGGHMLYAGALPVALVYDERLYLKVDAATRERFLAAGGDPFTYELRGRVVEMSFVAPPDVALEAADEMTPWARLALEAARRVRLTRAGRGGEVASAARPKRRKVARAAAAKEDPASPRRSGRVASAASAKRPSRKRPSRPKR